MKMETIEDMDKILEILNAEVAKRKIPYNARPDRTMAEYRALAENHEEYIALIKREKVITDAYFNTVQMQEWATSHKRWIETGYSTYQLSDIGKEILANFINKLEVSCE